ncbi:hypothetical protein [Halobacteriovorax sp. BALOs_7]|uniref:hypothetical protein n=1 Tax=Halobacteriovorax sp. BALOs_7 TaxID=2109558 RepID=UPI000EA2D1EB|nr:hypothetical protein [Halobacteriovorax sp. BALOs_7]
MSRNQFPTLLNQKATMLASLTRIDLLVVGSSYLILSWMKVSGLFSLATIALILVCLKFVSKRLKQGFFSHLNDEKKLTWQFRLGGRHE